MQTQIRSKSECSTMNCQFIGDLSIVNSSDLSIVNLSIDG